MQDVRQLTVDIDREITYMVAMARHNAVRLAVLIILLSLDFTIMNCAVHVHDLQATLLLSIIMFLMNVWSAWTLCLKR